MLLFLFVCWLYRDTKKAWHAIEYEGIKSIIQFPFSFVFCCCLQKYISSHLLLVIFTGICYWCTSFVDPIQISLNWFRTIYYMLSFVRIQIWFLAVMNLFQLCQPRVFLNISGCAYFNLNRNEIKTRKESVVKMKCLSLLWNIILKNKDNRSNNIILKSFWMLSPFDTLDN